MVTIGVCIQKTHTNIEKIPKYNRELLTITVGIEKFEHLLDGHNFTVDSDHKLFLTVNQIPKKLPKYTIYRRESLLQYIQQFNPNMEYLKRGLAD